MSLDHVRDVLGAACGHAALRSGERPLATGVGMDSRTIRPGDVFACIDGERVDGHDYAAVAVDAGAVAVLAARPLDVPVPVLVVPDVVKALGALAHAWRMDFKGVVVGVTGSAGKTTVKETLAQVLGMRGLTARNVMNFNNQIGMPLSMLAATGEEMFWVMEVGVSQPHDMDELGSVLVPDVALTLNVGGAHAEGLGEKGVAFHKARLLAHMRSGGVGLACADYPDLVREARAACPHVRFFSSTDQSAAYSAAYLGPAPHGRGRYRLLLDGESVDVTAPFCGAYGAENAAAIGAVARTLGLSAREMADGFARAVLPPQRFQVRRMGRWRVIDDTYNANPLSMARMVEAAAEMAGVDPLYAVLGGIAELGRTAQREHEKLGRLLAGAGVREIFWKGAYAEHVRAGLATANWRGNWRQVTDAEEFAALWKTLALPGGVVLCKGSRSNRLEELVSVLAKCAEEDDVL